MAFACTVRDNTKQMFYSMTVMDDANAQNDQMGSGG